MRSDQSGSTGKPRRHAGAAGFIPYVFVEQLDEILAEVTANGGAVEEAASPEGDLLVDTFRDPAGNVIGVRQLPSG